MRMPDCVWVGKSCWGGALLCRAATKFQPNFVKDRAYSVSARLLCSSGCLHGSLPRTVGLPTICANRRPPKKQFLQQALQSQCVEADLFAVCGMNGEVHKRFPRKTAGNPRYSRSAETPRPHRYIAAVADGSCQVCGNRTDAASRSPNKCIRQQNSEGVSSRPQSSTA